MIPHPGGSLPRRRCACGKFTRATSRLDLAEVEAEVAYKVASAIQTFPSTSSIRQIWNSDVALIICLTLDALTGKSRGGHEKEVAA